MRRYAHLLLNDVAKSCGSMPKPPKYNGYYYFEASAAVSRGRVFKLARPIRLLGAEVAQRSCYPRGQICRMIWLSCLTVSGVMPVGRSLEVFQDAVQSCRRIRIQPCCTHGHCTASGTVHTPFLQVKTQGQSPSAHGSPRWGWAAHFAALQIRPGAHCTVAPQLSLSWA